jgi:mevalonate kinase
MTSSLPLLSHLPLKAQASGKTILIGEHAVVYGYRALAMALPDIKLEMRLQTQSSPSWLEAWETKMDGKTVPMGEKIKTLLCHAFEKTLQLFDRTLTLNQVAPQKVHIQSQIPLGGGMGGSAAMSLCFVRLASQITNTSLSFEQEAQFANDIDSLFHAGKASGLDVNAAASDGFIQFQKGSGARKIANKCSFWLALIDSKERSETADMIEKVRQKITQKKDHINCLFQKIDSLAIDSQKNIAAGNVEALGKNLNDAHSLLRELGISTQKVDEIVVRLREKGALGAKITGAGGGGLVLGIFQDAPLFLKDLFGAEHVYLSRVCPESLSSSNTG